MLMSDGPWSPEHIYQEIVGYGKTRQRGESDDLDLSSYIMLLLSNFKPSIIKLYFSKCCRGVARVLADEGSSRSKFEEWSSCYL